ncbi:hypothetical protein P171DRAFT_433491 [Karstenula rhodostoma CBS 690.94]|uniref:Uncharacterized protein n=1 Tax=Karstenula rhodostoma CBS 690.94 TaxID=1392251 RepID=A0A9P4UBC5_9PLEO|nr:hypothetical protein P171DRAFT_433491 [Karstenula rhodostoma CBS 690.94]
MGLSKQQEAQADSSMRPEADAPPPLYTGPPTANQRSLVENVSADMASLGEGDPQETISVPMVHSAENVNWKKLWSKDRKVVSHSVVVRKMPREWYLKHYAKDAEGNYVGTEKPAVDAGLVFVPSKSTPDDLLQQVQKVAFGKQHYAGDFSSGVGMISGLGDGYALSSGPRK